MFKLPLLILAIILGFLLIVGITLLPALFMNPEMDESAPILPEGGIGGKAIVSPEVRRYEPLIRKYAEKYGVKGYTELLLAKMQQESGGRGGDPMQASESLGLPPNTITNPAVSIEAGVRYFSQGLKKAEGDIYLTIQAFNFGTGFIDYALERGGYSKEVAAAFSQMKAKELGWSRYGDINYVDNVLRYFEGSLEISPGSPNSYGFIKPIQAEITSRFGVRFDPFTGVPMNHYGVDFGCKGQPLPIYAARNGKIQRAGWQNPGNHNEGFGQRIYIDHGGGLVTVYAHLAEIFVQPGQTVQTGQKIGTCGTTGSSTGEHLHLELHENGRKVNPEGRIF